MIRLLVTCLLAFYARMGRQRCSGRSGWRRVELFDWAAERVLYFQDGVRDYVWIDCVVIIKVVLRCCFFVDVEPF
jgi:hypothetical protein